MAAAVGGGLQKFTGNLKMQRNGVDVVFQIQSCSLGIML